MTQLEEKLYALLRATMAGETFDAVMTDNEWRWLYRAAAKQSMVGVCYTERDDMPKDVAIEWVTNAEMIRGLNALLYQEAARLTTLFTEAGRRSAILKGQANARLYPDKYARQPGDIDIWVEGGRESVLALLPNHPKASYHHVHLPVNENGVVVEVHFRPSSGNFNPITNQRLQRWLEKEILSASMVEEGFRVPSVRFALVMQLAHVQRHFLAGGIGLRHVCDYYWLLQNSTAEDRRVVEGLLKEFGLWYTAGALMWVIGEALHLDGSLMLCEPDSYRGEWMLREIMEGGNFGRYAERQKHGVLRRVIEERLRILRLMKFDLWEVFWLEVNYWKAVVQTLPTRIKYRTLSLRDIPR